MTKSKSKFNEALEEKATEEKTVPETIGVDGAQAAQPEAQNQVGYDSEMHSNQNECQEEESKGVPSQEPRVDLPADVDMDEEVPHTHQSQAKQVPGDQQQ